MNNNFTDNSPITTLSTVASWVYTPNSSWVNEMHFGYDRATFNFVPNDAGIPANGTDMANVKAYALNTGITNPGGLPNIYIGPFGGIGFGSYLGTNPNRPQFSSDPYFDFSDSVSYLKGKHAFKFGGEYLHVEADDAIYVSGRGQVVFAGGQNLGTASTGLQDFFAGSPSKAVVLAGDPTRVVKWSIIGAYAQDDWRATQKLIVNFGLRYEYTSPMSADNNKFGGFSPTLGMVQQGQPGYSTMWKPDYRNFEPRLGFAWDVTGKGTTVVRGGASIMDASWVLNTWLAEFSLNNNIATSIAAVPTAANITTTGCVTLGICTPIVNGGGTISTSTVTLSPSQLNWKNNSPTQALFPPPAAQCGDGIGADPGPCDIMAADPNLRSPYVINYNLSVTHTFGSNLSLEVGYVGNAGRQLLGFRDINQPALGAGWCLGTLTAAQKADSCSGGPIAASSGMSLAAVQEARPFFTKFPYLRYINWGSNQAHSRYDSLQMTLTKRMSHGVSFTAGYTYGHGLDKGSLNRFGLLPQDSSNPAGDYSSSDFDIRHRLTLSATYNIPGIKGYAQALEGWQINTIVNLQTPQPWVIADSTNNFSGVGENTDRWNIFGPTSNFRSGAASITFCSGFDGTLNTTQSGVSCSYTTIYGGTNVPATSAIVTGCVSHASSGATLAVPTGGCYVSPNGQSFLTPPALGAFGNLGRNAFRDSGYKGVDFSVFKNFKFGERYAAQFRVEVFNLFNLPTFANPYGASNGYLGGGFDPSSGVLGYSGATPDFAAGNPLVGSGANRDIQLGFKFTF